MKYLLSAFSVIVCLLFATAAYAEEVIINANDDGEIIVPKKLTADDTEHVLISVEPDAAAVVNVNSRATTFSTLDYRRGLLDTLPKAMYTVSDVKMADNTVGTYAELQTGSYANIVKQQTVTFENDVQLSAFYYYSGLTGQPNVGSRYIFYKDNVVVANIGTSKAQEYVNLDGITIDKVVLQAIGHVQGGIYEIEFFGNMDIDYISAKDVRIADIKENSAKVSYLKPESIFYTHSEILLDGDVVAGDVEQHVLQDLEINTEYEVTIRSYYVDGNYVDTTVKFRTLKDAKPPGVVTDLTATQKDKNVLLEYTLPEDEDFSHVRILRNGLLVKSELKADNFEDENVPPGVHQYRVISYDESGNVSAVSVNITVVSMEVTQLKANTKADQVALSWVNPNHSELETVKIYRKDKNQGLMRSMFSLLDADDGFTALFATNGTTFEDLTVASDTTYTYKVTSVIDGEETTGVTIDVKTPKLTVDGGTITPQPDKENPTSYVIAWTSPKNGKLKVVIAGVDYKTVNAADLKVTIPASDMKFDKFGNYDVQLVPVDDQGQVIGVPTNPGSGGLTWGGINLGNLGLDPKSLITVGAALLGLIGLIILLAMSFRLVPRLMELLKNSFR